MSEANARIHARMEIGHMAYSEPDEPSFESDLYSVISEDVGLDFEIECDD